MKFFVISIIFIFGMSVHANNELLKHDSSGNVISGSRQALIDAVLEGYEISVQIDGLNQIFTGKQTSVLTISGVSHVCQMIRTNAVNMTAMDTYTDVNDPYWVHYCSNGKNYTRHWVLGNGNNTGGIIQEGQYYTSSYAMTWRKGENAPEPEEIFINDASGNEVFNTKADLKAAILAGKKVVVKFGSPGSEKVYRGSFPQIHGNEVCLMHFVWAFNISNTVPYQYHVVSKPFSKNMCTTGTEHVKHPSDPNETVYTDNQFQMTWIVVD